MRSPSFTAGRMSSNTIPHQSEGLDIIYVEVV